MGQKRKKPKEGAMKRARRSEGRGKTRDRNAETSGKGEALGADKEQGKTKGLLKKPKRSSSKPKEAISHK